MTFFAHPRNEETKDSTVPVIPIPVIPIPVIPIKKNDIANANPLFKIFITYWLLIYYIYYIYKYKRLETWKKLIGITGIGIDRLSTFS